jgi:uncharacterized protein (TIGR02284 family)
MTAETTITDVLNDLITINKDHVVGLKEAIHALDKKQKETRQALKMMLEHSEGFIKELKKKIHELGAEVTDKTITSGLVYNTWMDIIYSNANEKPEIRNFCDQVESMTLQGYDSALQKLKDLDKNVFDMVFQQKQVLLKCCNEVKTTMGNYR